MGEDHVFTFTVDWRLGQVDAAKRLDDFIQQVKALTGHQKVNLHSISHGGQLVGFYLFYYGYKQDVNNAVLNVPALCGSSIVADLLYNEGISFDEHTLMQMVQAGFVMENDFDWLFDLIPLDMLDEPARALIWEGLWPILRYCGSVWDLLPEADYRVLRDRYLDPVENAALIEKLDESHFQVMPQMGESLRRARNEYGVNVSIMASTGNGLATGSQSNSDFIIDTQYTSGAYCAEVGERFPNNYQPKATVCSNPSHNHVSPSMEVDASCAFLPENTWFIEGQFHGMSYWDDYSKSLYLKLLLTDELENVRSNSAIHSLSSPTIRRTTFTFSLTTAAPAILHKKTPHSSSPTYQRNTACGCGRLPAMAPSSTSPLTKRKFWSQVKAWRYQWMGQYRMQSGFMRPLSSIITIAVRYACRKHAPLA